VLAAAVLKWLEIRPEGAYVDCTAGAGGHSELIARSLTGGRLIALDRDPVAVALASERLANFPQVTVLQANYAQLGSVLNDIGVGPVQGVLIDAGVSSMQIDDPGRGFSLQHDGPLDMRMNPTEGVTALEYLATVEPDELANTLRTFGDVGPARRVAKLLSSRAREGRIRTTVDLVRTVQEALSFVRGIPEEVRTVFQAIRIAVNDELSSLSCGVEQAIDSLAPEGRLVAISFHSGEDRIVKNLLNLEGRPRREFHPDGRLKHEMAPRLRVLTRKPIVPDAAEVQQNPRAHSARLRAAERVRADSAP
jgi:16S rRNA (cytosine1402-N4)-methyltransferase